MEDFHGKVVIVAGGTGGLGRATSLEFLRAGARVAATYRRAEEFDALRAAAAENAERLEPQPLDAADEVAANECVQRIAGQHGRIDALVNAIGGYAGGPPLWESDAQTYQRMLALNLQPGFVLARAVVPQMLRQGGGAIVNVASKAGYGHAAGAAAYAASKAAALALFDSLAEEVKGRGIRVNSVVPNIIDTEPNRRAMPKADFSRWPKPEEVARVIVFLCSEDARVIHGAAIPVYGMT
jgi:NAD(P)-dependent dehydrogenase (short-subunit alcohol dehydrogenase family)